MSLLRLNETKVTTRNGFTDNIFPLKSNEESKNDEITFLLNCFAIINETKVTTRKDLIEHIFALESKKESKNDKKRILFWDSFFILCPVVNP